MHTFPRLHLQKASNQQTLTHWGTPTGSKYLVSMPKCEKPSDSAMGAHGLATPGLFHPFHRQGGGRIWAKALKRRYRGLFVKNSIP